MAVSVLNSAIYFTATSTIARFGGLLVQFVLGWVLVKEDYGVFAIALSISAVASCLRNGGTDQIIVQRGSEYIDLAPKIATFSLLFNFLSCILVILFSDLISDYYGNDTLKWLLVILAVGYLLATPGPILIAQLSIDKKFKSIAKINLVTILSKHILTILLALIGMGVFSLAIPLAIQSLIAAFASYMVVKQWPGFAKLKNVSFTGILDSSIWVIVSNLAFQLAANIQYFILGSYFSAALIGIYFFAVQLVNSPIALINNTVKGVVFPSLSGIYEEREKYKKAVLKSVVTSYSLGVVIAVLGFFMFPLIADYLWDGKWSDSNVYIELMCLMAPSIILGNTVYEILSSAGMWKKRFFILLFSTLIEFLAIILTVGFDDMKTVILSLAIFRSVSVMLMTGYVISTLLSQSSMLLVIRFILPYVFVVFGYFFINYFTSVGVTWYFLALVLLVFIYYFYKFNQCFDLVSKLSRKFTNQ